MCPGSATCSGGLGAGDMASAETPVYNEDLAVSRDPGDKSLVKDQGTKTPEADDIIITT